MGWLNPFMNRHLFLTTRTSQVIKFGRSEATEEGLKIFIWELTKHVIGQKMMDNRIFNTGKTGFYQKNKTKKVISVTVSKNVLLKSAEASFHMTIVAFVAANGFSIPPLFIIPGQIFNLTILDQCSITVITATVSPKGFMKSKFVIKLLDLANVPGHVNRPIVPVYYNYGIHYSMGIVEK